LREGDLAKADAELSALQGRPLEAATPWMQAVTARIAADRALSELTASVAAQTAKGGD
jgi:hypothetical protein